MCFLKDRQKDDHRLGHKLYNYTQTTMWILGTLKFLKSDADDC